MSTKRPSTARLILRTLLQVGLFTLIPAACLFIAAWQLDWAMAWVYLGVMVANYGLVSLILILTNPELVMERTGTGGKRDLDRVLAGVMALYGPALTCVVAGLDVRLGWSEISPALQIAALVVLVLGSLLTVWAMLANRFFYGVLRIAPDQGHTVATGGPYRYVRHPGYVGAILFDLAAPLVLGSWWALIPAVLTVCAIAVRTAMEDRALQEGLDGYAEYAQRTRYRLLPGVW